MGLFGKKADDESQEKFAAHPVFKLTAGMPQAEVIERIGAPTEVRTAAEVMAEFAGPGATIDPAKVPPEEYWSYTDVPEGFHLEIHIREEHLVEVRVRKNGSNELAVRIDDQGVSAGKNYRLALRAHRL